MRDRHAGRPGDRYAISFRRQFLVVTVCLLAVNLMIGLFARHQQRAIIDYAVNIYDTAFISTNYVSLAQIAFQHYIDDRSRAAGPARHPRPTSCWTTCSTTWTSPSKGRVLISPAPRDRKSGRASAELLEARGETTPASRIAGSTIFSKKMERLHQNNSAIGLQARDDIEAFSYKSDLLLLGSILTSIMLAGLVLLVTHRMISSMNRRSSDHLYAALEGMPQGLTMFDDKQRLIICNAKYARCTDFPPG